MQEEFPNIETVLVRIIRVSSESAKGAPLIDRESGQKQKAVAYVLPWEEQWLGKHGTTRYYLLNQIPSDLQAGDKRWCKIIRQSIRTKPAVKPNAMYPRDGSRKEHWDYSIAEWDVDRESTLPVAQQPVATPPSEQPANQKSVSTQYKPKEEKIPDNQIKIMRQTALKCASWIVVPTVAEMGIETSVKKSMEIANLFLDYVISGEIPNSKAEKQAEEQPQEIDEEWN